MSPAAPFGSVSKDSWPVENALTEMEIEHETIKITEANRSKDVR